MKNLSSQVRKQILEDVVWRLEGTMSTSTQAEGEYIVGRFSDNIDEGEMANYLWQIEELRDDLVALEDREPSLIMIDEYNLTFWIGPLAPNA